MGKWREEERKGVKTTSSQVTWRVTSKISDNALLCRLWMVCFYSMRLLMPVAVQMVLSTNAFSALYYFLKPEKTSRLHNSNKK